MRTSALVAVTASLLGAALVTSCSQAENNSSTAQPKVAPTVSQTAAPAASPTLTPFVSQTAAPPVSRSKPLPPDADERSTEAEFNGYPYSYKKDGKKTDATFSPKLLPWDRDLVADAIRDVIEHSYGDKVDSAPRLVGTGAAQTIRIAGKKHQYVVVLVTEPTGEIHSLIITQLN